jgi:hypothetical protein
MKVTNGWYFKKDAEPLAATHDHWLEESPYSTTVPGLFSREDRIRSDVDLVTVRLNYRTSTGFTRRVEDEAAAAGAAAAGIE